MNVGQHLFTKDGRAIGNGIIIEASNGRYRIETDFGNNGEWLTENEIHDWWHTERDGAPVISDLERWRGDRDKARARQP